VEKASKGVAWGANRVHYGSQRDVWFVNFWETIYMWSQLTALFYIVWF
jgi:hypothetical protein